MKPKVWTEVDLHPEALARLQAEADVITGGALDDLAVADAAIIGASHVDGAFLDRAGSSLKLVIRHGIGYNAVDVPAASARGILAANTPDGPTESTAEHAVGLLLAVWRRIPEAVRGHGTWQQLRPGMRSLADSRVMVLGYGSIGRALTHRLLAHGARVTAVATRAREDDLVGPVHPVEELPGLLPTMHAVVVLLPLSERTQGFVGADFLAALPDGALVVNVARGGVVDTDAVIAASGRLSFALDVTDPEPLPDGHPLWDAPDVLITPHVAGGTTAMLPRMSALVREQLGRYLAGHPLRNVVAGPDRG